MKLKYKSFEIKSDDNGQISGYFSTYDRIPDSYGDVVAPGAFTETIKAREESGHPFPLCWNHDLDQIIGMVETIKDDPEKGPLMTASFFNTQLAQEKRELVKSGCVYQFSFAYRVLDGDWITIDGRDVFEIKKVELFEVSVVPIPANPLAEVTEIKSGKRNSKKDSDALKEAINLIQKGVETINGVLDESDESGAEEDPKPNDEKSEEAKALNAKKAEILTFINNMEEN